MSFTKGQIQRGIRESQAMVSKMFLLETHSVWGPPGHFFQPRAVSSVMSAQTVTLSQVNKGGGGGIQLKKKDQQQLRFIKIGVGDAEPKRS